MIIIIIICLDSCVENFYNCLHVEFNTYIKSFISCLLSYSFIRHLIDVLVTRISEVSDHLPLSILVIIKAGGKYVLTLKNLRCFLKR